MFVVCVNAESAAVLSSVEEEEKALCGACDAHDTHHTDETYVALDVA